MIIEGNRDVGGSGCGDSGGGSDGEGVEERGVQKHDPSRIFACRLEAVERPQTLWYPFSTKGRRDRGGLNGAVRDREGNRGVRGSVERKGSRNDMCKLLRCLVSRRSKLLAERVGQLKVQTAVKREIQTMFRN
uniref:Uncharacterized protein n=1 Tax=Vespula pensylvanica TaxID=30213 RepID=A0A834PEN6_VESPE|nr:hypothetical protein H0235_000132 [Vespula pensylvanica]